MTTGAAFLLVGFVAVSAAVAAVRGDEPQPPDPGWTDAPGAEWRVAEPFAGSFAPPYGSGTLALAGDVWRADADTPDADMTAVLWRAPLTAETVDVRCDEGAAWLSRAQEHLAPEVATAPVDADAVARRCRSRWDRGEERNDADRVLGARTASADGFDYGASLELVDNGKGPRLVAVSYVVSAG
ncbi:hypothetical protein [Nocardioides sp. YIM 152588]|uniref:hypothetical protein n=1 Tax=Nocardioides sp. YIM 152588 TaxID=3158259 RepID=UPI0032E40341